MGNEILENERFTYGGINDWLPDIPKADISDYFAAGHSKAEFESLLQ